MSLRPGAASAPRCSQTPAPASRLAQVLAIGEQCRCGADTSEGPKKAKPVAEPMTFLRVEGLTEMPKKKSHAHNDIKSYRGNLAIPFTDVLETLAFGGETEPRHRGLKVERKYIVLNRKINAKNEYEDKGFLYDYKDSKLLATVFTLEKPAYGHDDIVYSVHQLIEPVSIKELIEVEFKFDRPPAGAVRVQDLKISQTYSASEADSLLKGRLLSKETKANENLENLKNVRNALVQGSQPNDPYERDYFMFRIDH